MTDFETAFALHVENIEALYKRRIMRQINRLAADDGTLRAPAMREYSAYLPGIRYLRPRRKYESMRLGAELVIATDFLDKEARQFAEDQVARCIAKLRRKVEGIDALDVRLRGVCEFTLRGTAPGGEQIVVEQQSALKVSSRNTLYMQWPARIYVDGKFTSEKAFRNFMENAA